MMMAMFLQWFTLAFHQLFHFKFGVNRCGSTFASTVISMCVDLACSNIDCVARIMNENKVDFFFVRLSINMYAVIILRWQNGINLRLDPFHRSNLARWPVF